MTGAAAPRGPVRQEGTRGPLSRSGVPVRSFPPGQHLGGSGIFVVFFLTRPAGGPGEPSGPVSRSGRSVPSAPGRALPEAGTHFQARAPASRSGHVSRSAPGSGRRVLGSRRTQEARPLGSTVPLDASGSSSRVRTHRRSVISSVRGIVVQPSGGPSPATRFTQHPCARAASPDMREPHRPIRKRSWTEVNLPWWDEISVRSPRSPDLAGDRRPGIPVPPPARRLSRPVRPGPACP